MKSSTCRTPCSIACCRRSSPPGARPRRTSAPARGLAGSGALAAPAATSRAANQSCVLDALAVARSRSLRPAPRARPGSAPRPAARGRRRGSPAGTSSCGKRLELALGLVDPAAGEQPPRSAAGARRARRPCAGLPLGRLELGAERSGLLARRVVARDASSSRRAAAEVAARQGRAAGGERGVGRASPAPAPRQSRGERGLVARPASGGAGCELEQRLEGQAGERRAACVCEVAGRAPARSRRRARAGASAASRCLGGEPRLDAASRPEARGFGRPRSRATSCSRLVDAAGGRGPPRARDRSPRSPRDRARRRRARSAPAARRAPRASARSSCAARRRARREPPARRRPSAWRRAAADRDLPRLGAWQAAAPPAPGPG